MLCEGNAAQCGPQRGLLHLLVGAGNGFRGMVNVEDAAADAKTVWHYAEMPVQPGKAEELLHRFNEYLDRQGCSAQGGRLLDASIVKAPRNRNMRGGNAAVRNGEAPEKREGKPWKLRRKDLDAGWIQKSGETHCGCRNHANVDREHKLVRLFHVTDASVHDSQAVDHLLDTGNSSSEVWADSACRSEAIDERLRERGLKGRIHRKSRRGKPSGGRCKQGNRTRSKARVRAGHVFGA